MNFSARKFLMLATMITSMVAAPSRAQTSGGESSAQDSSYPGWATQAGPIAPVPFRKFSAGVSLSPSDFQGSVGSAPATPGILNLSLDDAIRRGLDSNLAIRLRSEQETISQGQRNLALQG